MEKLSYKFKKADEFLVVKIKGYIDTTTVGVFKKMFEEIYNILPEKVFVDFKMVEYVSSSGWGTLVSNSKKMEEKGMELFVGRMSEPVKKIFDLMNLGRFIKYTDEIPEGVEEVKVEEKKEEIVEEVDKKIKVYVKNLIVENPFMNEEEIKESLEKKWGRQVNDISLKRILVSMGLETREKRLAFAYKTLKKIIERKR